MFENVLNNETERRNGMPGIGKGNFYSKKKKKTRSRKVTGINYGSDEYIFGRLQRTSWGKEGLGMV